MQRKMTDYIQQHPELNLNSTTTMSEFRSTLANVDRDLLTSTFYLNTKQVDRYSYHDICVSEFDKIVTNCSHLLLKSCLQRKIRVLKVIRLTMQNIGDILKSDPTVRVLYLVRDPRAIAHSRVNVGVTSWYARGLTNVTSDRIIHEATMICHKMRHDLQVLAQLKLSYPETFLLIQYEHMARNPVATQQSIYRFLNLAESPEVTDWIRKSTNATHANGAFGTARRNATDTAFQWETDVSYRTVKIINENCRDILDKFDYDML